MTDECARQLHIIPTEDLVDHDTRYWNACLCGPALATQQHHENGAMHWDVLVTHHALDGRQ
jgi:hypothetical protein